MSKLYVRDIIEKLECDLLVVYFDGGIKREYSHERMQDKPSAISGEHSNSNSSWKYPMRRTLNPLYK